MVTVGDASVSDDLEVDAEQDEEEGGFRIGDIYIPSPPPPACTFDFTGPRLIISHIENVNFKSYAGKQMLGPLHKSFTAIVGPNGSGKSNVIDSMLFVFGYRAQKIRSKKISVLIHKSDKFPNLESCTVHVHFHKIVDTNDEEFEVVPNSEFVVSRTATKDNSSWYALNGQKVPFREISKLLRTHGIDFDHNRFLILQGEVEEIAMMKPKALTPHETGMLEYLEDIIGSSRFKVPIEQLSKNIEELNEQRAEKLNRVRVVETEKNDLEGARNEAVEYLKLENDITIKKNSLYQKYRYESEMNESAVKEKMDSVKDSMKDLLDEMENVKKNRTEKGKEHKAQSAIYAQCSKQVDGLKEEYSTLEREDLQQRENLKHAKTKGKKMEKTLDKEKETLTELTNQPEKLEKEIEELNVRQKKLEEQLTVEEKKLSKVLASLQEETKGLQEEKNTYEAELSILQQSVHETKAKLDLAKSELDILLSGEQNEKQKLENLTTKYNQVCTSRQEMENSLKDIEKRIPATEKSSENGQTRLVQLEDEERKISGAVWSSQMKVEEARSSMQANRSRSQVMQALMRQKYEGKLPGILGRLGDLGAIDEKYDVAISTACPRLDNIVTDTMTTAQKCVQFLKQQNVGVATFIALDKMEKWIPYTKQRIDTPENVPRLFDLVQVRDERMLPAFYFSLQNTLVADTLEQAVRIGMQGRVRHKVVTLKGELIEISGTMSGGGGRPMRGRMGQSIVASDISVGEMENLIANMEELKGKHEQIVRKKQELEASVKEGQIELRTLRQSEQRLKMELQGLKDQEKQLVKQLDEQKIRVASSTTDKKQLKKLQDTVDAAQMDYENASKSAGKVQDQVQRLHGVILEITEGKTGAAKKKVDSIRKQMETVNSAITKDGLAIKTNQRNMQKCETKIASLEEEMRGNAENVEKAKEGFKELEEKAKKIMEQLEVANEKKDAVEAAVHGIAIELKKIQERDRELQSNHVEVKNKLDKFNSNLQEAQRLVKHWQNQLRKLTLQEIDGKEQADLSEIAKDELEKLDTKAAQYSIALLEERLHDMKPNLAAIAEYKKKETMYLQRVGELDEVTLQRDTQRKHHDNLKKARLADFMKGFVIISNKLKEMYQMITLGGDAELDLVDSLDPFSEGIVFSVRPPRKSWKSITNLSGGEKTLSSLALVFALHYYRPSPLYVMDEIDAALDFRNVSIVGNYIKERTKNAQFIIISLRDNMFELADRLVGIYKTYNCTKTVTINPGAIGNS